MFDTNALPVKGLFRSTFWVALFHLCTTSGIMPAASEVAVAEAINLRRDMATSAIDDLLSAHSRLSNLTELSPTYVPTAEDVARSYGDDLRERLEILPLAGEHAVEALKREASRMKPARGGVGGRDSAIWLTVAALVHGGHTVYFITNNSRDFGKGSLDPELDAEIAGASGRLIYCRDANEFLALIADKVESPSVTDADVAGVFVDSLRSQLIALVESVDSDAYTVERALEAVVSVANVRLKSSYVLESGGLAWTSGDVDFSDPSAMEPWSKGKFTGWLAFDEVTGDLSPSEIDALILDL